MRTLIITALLFSLQALASEENVATVLIKRGDITAKLPDGKELMLTVNQKLPVGTTLQTKDKSFVKLIFSDKSTLNLGPSSQMVIQSYPKKEAGIIKLMSGQIRAEVSKNYMQIDDKSKSKLFIQTKSASMGIRGTDFQVNYNPENDNSSLIVFEGKVAMGSIDRNMAGVNLDQKKLEEIVSSSTAVMVRQGQFSAVNHALAERPLIPTKLAPKQLDVLKDNTTGLEDASAKENGKKRNIVPPGLDSSSFINAPADVVKAEMKDAEGFSNAKTGEFKPAAGTMIDLKNVAIVEPAKGSTFDPSTKTYSVSLDMAKVNEKTGQLEVAKNIDLSKNAVSTAPVAKNDAGASASAPAKVDAPAVVADAPKKVDAPVAVALAADAPKKVDAVVQSKEVAAVANNANDEAAKKLKEAEDTAKKAKEAADLAAASKAKEEADKKAKDAADAAAAQKAKEADDAARKLKDEADKRQKEIDDALKAQREQDDKNKQVQAEADKKQRDENDRQAKLKKELEEALQKAKKDAEDALILLKQQKEAEAAREREASKHKKKKENHHHDEKHHDEHHGRG